MLFKKKAILIDILIIFLLSLTPLLWFKPGEMMVGHDNVFPLAPKTFLKGRLFTWIQNQGFGESQSLIMGTIPIHFLDALPNLLGFSLITTQKIVYVFWFFLIGLSAYILAHFIKKDSRFFKLLVATLYQFNFFILQGWFIGERTKFSVMIAAPLVLSVFLLVYESRMNIWLAAIPNSLILFFFNAGGLLGIPLYGGLFISVGLFILWFGILGFFQKNYQAIKKLIFVFLLTLIGCLLLNSYYLLPVLGPLLGRYRSDIGGMGGIFGVIDWAGEISANTSFTNLFRLQGSSDWYDNPEHPYAKFFLNNPTLIIISFIWPLLAFFSLSLTKNKKGKYILYFFLVYLVGLFFAAGVHPPLGFIYIFLMKYIPGFIIFRTPYFKFAPAMFLSSSFLCAFTLDALKEKLSVLVSRVRLLKFLPAFFGLLCFILIFVYHFPYFTGNIFNWQGEFSTRLKVPQYIFDFKTWLEKEWKRDGRILMLPINNYQWQYEVYNWGYLSLQPLTRLFTNEPVIISGEGLSSKEVMLLDTLNKALLERNNDLLKKTSFIMGIKYFLLRKDFSYNLSWIPTDSPFSLQEILKNGSDYPLVKKFGEWELYEIASVSPPKFTTTQELDLVPPLENNKLLAEYLTLSLAKRASFVFGGPNNPGSKKIPEGIKSHYFIVPECITCGNEASFHLIFPERVILPDSLLYPLMKQKEKWGFKGGDSKGKIYHQLGLTIKRLAEIRESFYQRRLAGKKKILFEDYINILEQMEISFGLIDKEKDKIKIAEDLNRYLKEEEKYFRDFLGRFINDSEEVADLKKVIARIGCLQEVIDPWLFKQTPLEDNLYFLDNPEDGQYDILISSEYLPKAFSPADKLTIKIDNFEVVKELAELKNNQKRWINLGPINLAKGEHKMFTHLRGLPNLAIGFTPWQEDRNCFISQLKNYDNRRNYLFRLDYRNDFSDNLRLFFITNTVKSEKEDVFKLDLVHGQGLFEELIRSDAKNTSVSVAVCAPEFANVDFFKNIIMNLETREIVYPLVIFSPNEPSFSEKSLSSPLANYKKLNSTQYQVSIKNAQVPYVLRFEEKFDPDWRIYLNNKEVFGESHFLIDAYANGWLIDGAGDYDLVIKYFPQKLFWIGIIISTMTLMGTLLVIFYIYFRRNRCKL